MSGPSRVVAMLVTSALLLSACTLVGGGGEGATGGGDDDPAERSAADGVVDPAGVLTAGWQPSGSLASEPRQVDGLTLPASQDGERLLLHTASGDVDFWTGVNLGPTVPGHQPGELAVDRATSARWFEAIAATGVHAVRVYTIQPPHFYEELLAFNEANPDRPLYVVHGVWIPEEEFVGSEDLWDPGVVAAMEADVRSAVAVVHGDAQLPDRAGFASGSYTADISPWVVSWALGIEMDPQVTLASDTTNAGRDAHQGTYVTSTEDASPTETWLARILDRLATEEADRGRSVPLTFTNWPTTDPLEHPTEPLDEEDLVGIDANHVVPTDAWPAGGYASYHAYPYYPDFQRYEPGMADFELDGAPDNYAGYLTALRDHHAGLPVVVLEFGLPTSLGNAHLGPQGRDQGGHTEADAMRMNAELLDAQRAVGVAGGFLFAWQDEWFKVTWNTLDLELPAERRALWHNALTNESYFGLLAIEPGATGRVVPFDGSGDEWPADRTQVLHGSDDRVQRVRAAHDPQGLYLQLAVDGAPWADGTGVHLAFTRFPDAPAGPLPGRPDVTSGADHLLVVDDDRAEAFTRAAEDVNLNLYGPAGFVEVDAADLDPVSGTWEPARQIVNRPLTLPVSGEERPAEWHELNPLPRGSAAPTAEDFDDRAVWNATDGMLELHVPWALIGFADPSSRQALVFAEDGTITTREVDRLGITVLIGDDEPIELDYGWDEWNQVEWHERLKDGADVLVARLRDLAMPAS